jgi:hypothetical protein
LAVSSGASVDAAIIDGGTVEIASGGSAGADPIAFTSSGGTLRLADSVHFSGTIAGFADLAALDLADIAFGSSMTLGFSEAQDGTRGTLTVGDGVRTVSLTLLGQYVVESFALQSDGNGGTRVIDPPIADLLHASPVGST